MNPGLVVKLRPSGPWRIGPDSGARNRVDVIYHSDSLYSAVTAAMSRLGWLEEWLDATARTGAPAVSFSSCFPYLGELAFVVPPRTVWPPASPSAKAARIRWKSARFVPLSVVQAILAGQRLDDNQWSVDGPSDCLVPTGKPGPFRTAVRSNAGVDRLTGASERHSTACIEFRAGSGLWTVVSFTDEAAHESWSGKVKAAFRLLADTGFGGERSRGWGRSDAPEFIDGMLPDLILPTLTESAAATVEPAEPIEAAVLAPSPVVELAVAASAEPEPAAPPPDVAPKPELAAPVDTEPVAMAEPESTPVAIELEPIVGASEPAHVAPETAPTEPVAAAEPEPTPVAIELEPIVGASKSAPIASETATTEPVATAAAEPEPVVASEPAPVAAEIAAPAAEPVAVAAEPAIAPEPAVATPEPAPPAHEPTESAAPATLAEASPQPVVAGVPTHPHWLLSLFTPAAADSVDWRRGNYTVLPRGGRVDSPAGSGELKKQIQMVAEGSVVYAETAPRGSAADVAPDGFAHPVFRAGFAVAIPLPEVR